MFYRLTALGKLSAFIPMDHKARPTVAKNKSVIDLEICLNISMFLAGHW